MAMKKIRLDFSKTEERSGWNTKALPEGLHKMKIEGVEETEAGDGTPMLVFALVPEDPRYKTRRFPFYCKLQQNQLWKLRDLLVSAGQTVPKKAMNLDPSVVVGKFIAAECEDETGQYAGRSSINSTYGVNILDEDGDDNAPEDDESEDEDEDEADAEDEAEEEAEAALEDMTLAELRTLAKSLGISTVKKTKDELVDEITDAEADTEEEPEDEDEEEDDSDLEEEELYEDDEEEEEEEPAAPVRRKAAPAKAAPAPAKRVVRRR